ncbi:MAG TPA: dihydroorotase [Solirubrobacterales bacterium]|nr:dihydroorotase [Solirubrobacterales bacterium]
MSFDSSPLIGRGGPAADLIISRVRALDPVAGIDGVYDLVVRGGRIEALAEPGSAADAAGSGGAAGRAGAADAAGSAATELIDGEGLTAFPGFFDPHVHLRTPGQEHKEDLQTGTRAAAAGGYCGVIAMANTSPPVSTPADIAALRERAATQASIPVGFLATATVGMAGEELTEMVALRQAGAIGFSDDGLPIRDAAIMRRVLQYQRMCGGNLALHEEEPALSADGVMHEGEVSAILGLAGIPAASERVQVERDIALAEFEGGRIHLQHLSCAESVAAVRAAKARIAAGETPEGFAVTAEATPHHLCLTDEAVRSLDPARFKMNPPLRSEADRQALLEGLRDGTVECVATDHAPHAPEDKQVPFEQAAMGVTGLEVAFAALHTELVLGGAIGLELLVDRLAGGAEPFGIARPSLAVGSEANVALCDLGMEWVPGAEGYESRSTNCWCDGRRLTGRPVVTLAAGRIAYRLRSFSVGAV